MFEKKVADEIQFFVDIGAFVMGLSQISFFFSLLLRFYLSAYTICPGLLLVWMFYSEGQATFQ